MRLKADFEIVEIADEYLAIPVGEMATFFHGVIALSEPAAFILRQMKESKSQRELCELIVNEYNIDVATAEIDVKGFVSKAIEIGLIEE